MRRKKIIALISIGVMLSVVGITMAWFTAKDNVVNRFSTAGWGDGENDKNDPDFGVKIDETDEDKTTGGPVEDGKGWTQKSDENGDPLTKEVEITNPDGTKTTVQVPVYERKDDDSEDLVVPGVEVNKDVRVQNTANYVSFIRVKFIPTFISSPVDLSKLDNNMIVPNVNTNNIKEVAEEGYWIKGEKDVDGLDWYYYMKVVEPKEFTSYLLDSVSLSLDADNTYKNAQFDVLVSAQSVQATNGAYDSVWNKMPQEVKDMYAQLEK